MDQILYEAADRVAVISLNRPEVANAQSMELLDDLDAAWTRAAADDEVRVIVLRGNGKHFSSGHDLKGPVPAAEQLTLEWIYQAETRMYLDYSLRWRNVPKPSIAAVQGKCIAGGLLLCWPCDLIVAADNAQFSDPVVRLGIGGVEYHGHTWELGPRKAKEILFTGRAVTAEEAEQTGMVNRVVPLADLERPRWSWPARSPRCTRSRCGRPSGPSTRPWTYRASTRRSSRCSTSTRPGTVTRYPSPATRSSPG